MIVGNFRRYMPSSFAKVARDRDPGMTELDSAGLYRRCERHSDRQFVYSGRPVDQTFPRLLGIGFDCVLGAFSRKDPTGTMSAVVVSRDGGFQCERPPRSVPEISA